MIHEILRGYVTLIKIGFVWRYNIPAITYPEGRVLALKNMQLHFPDSSYKLAAMMFLTFNSVHQAQ